ncbi:MAG: hypothetical protein CM1200mP33_3940 [Chloroflexota bacterium]|nr:MAG: hypothetical protein CM1200mP33_3940 [Chloroflexota bacterium]
MLDNGDKLEKLELIDINGQSFDIANYKGKKFGQFIFGLLGEIVELNCLDGNH